MTVRVRAASAGDAPVLARLRHEFRSSLADSTENEVEFVDRCTGWMESRLREGRGWRAWVAEKDARIIGTIWLGTFEKIPNPAPEPEEYGYITNMYVVPGARGEGVGTALVTEAIRWCEERGVHSIVLWSTKRSAPLYHRHGFAPPVRLLEHVVTDVSMPGAFDPG